MYKRIVVPVDGSETAQKALVTALQMARESSGCVHLVHVVEGLTPMTADPYGAYSGDVIEVMRQSGRKILDDALALARAEGVQADTQLFDNFGERLAEVRRHTRTQGTWPRAHGQRCGADHPSVTGARAGAALQSEQRG